LRFRGLASLLLASLPSLASLASLPSLASLASLPSLASLAARRHMRLAGPRGIEHREAQPRCLIVIAEC